MSYVVLAHGGASSRNQDKDGPERAARSAVAGMRSGGSPLDAVVEAVADLEDDPRFNAGTGSNLRFDGATIEMDASCMDGAGAGRFGAVALIRDVKNPVRVAREVLRTPHNLIGGDGAIRFARSLGYGSHDPTTEKARDKFRLLREGLRASKIDPEDFPWDVKELERAWNYEVPLKRIMGPDDTVGAVATDGRTFAAALSTGGTMSTLLGRVGDVPLPGCGLHAGPAGAVAATGDGDRLARAMIAHRVYRWLEEGRTAQEALDEAFRALGTTEAGFIILGKGSHAGGSNRDMAWAVVEG